MKNNHVRATDGSRVVLVLSSFLHPEGRECHCGAKWTIYFDANGCHVRRNGVQADSAILDWTGNNVAVECCQKA